MKKKDIALTVTMIILFLALIVGLIFFGIYRSHQIENGKIELIYQYGGDL